MNAGNISTSSNNVLRNQNMILRKHPNLDNKLDIVIVNVSDIVILPVSKYKNTQTILYTCVISVLLSF